MPRTMTCKEHFIKKWDVIKSQISFLQVGFKHRIESEIDEMTLSKTAGRLAVKSASIYFLGGGI